MIKAKVPFVTPKDLVLIKTIFVWGMSGDALTLRK